MSVQKENFLKSVFSRVGIRTKVALEILSTVRLKSKMKKVGEWTDFQQILSEKYQTSITNVMKTCQILKKKGLLEYKKGYYYLGDADYIENLEQGWKEFLKKGEVT
jgi:hypothetical protein